MLEILNNIFKSMLQDGYQVHAVYGSRWLQSFKGVNDKVTFYIEPQQGNFDSDANERNQRLKWVVAYETPQNHIDENDIIITEEQIWDINKRFIARLKAYTTTTGLQPFYNFGLFAFSAFHDLTLFELPASGFTFEVTFNQIETTFCE